MPFKLVRQLIEGSNDAQAAVNGPGKRRGNVHDDDNAVYRKKEIQAHEYLS